MSKLYYRLSLMRDADVLEQAHSDFHGIFLEAHIVELYTNAVGAFLAKIAKPYVIDPVLYKFGYPFFGDIADKRWVAPLAEAYGVDDLTSQNPDGFQAADISTSDVAAIARGVLEYQRSKIAALSSQAVALASLVGSAVPSIRPPEFLVAPYLYAVDDATFQVCTRLLEQSIRLRKSGEYVYAAIAMPGEFLGDRAKTTSISREYSRLHPDGYLLWLGDFRDWEEHSSYLVEMANFARGLSSSTPGAKVINLFGGYYSTILSARGLLGGNVQGVAMSEYRDPLASGGGFAKRYYVPISHQSVGVDLASDLRNANSQLVACPCSQCITSRLPNTMSVRELAKHFVETRRRELDHAARTAALGVAGGLRTDGDSLDGLRGTPVGGLAAHHADRLRVWAITLEALINQGVIS